MLIISPKTKIGELLEAYPELEDVLIGMSPVFAKLRNPVLRKTVAKVATIQQIAVVGGLPLNDIIKRLRQETGQPDVDENGSAAGDQQALPPAWFNENKITDRFDATPVINSGGSPMGDVLKKSMQLEEGNILELHTPFVPAPIIDMLREKGFTAFSVQKKEDVISYITRAEK
jgi:hypothetical protein